MKIKICGLSTKEAVDTAVESVPHISVLFLVPQNAKLLQKKFFKSQTMSQKQSKK